MDRAEGGARRSKQDHQLQQPRPLRHAEADYAGGIAGLPAL